MKRLSIVPVLIFLFGIIESAAQNADITPGSQDTVQHDTPVIFIDSVDSEHVSDKMISEIYQIPCYNLYDGYWDTENLCSRQLEIPFVDDKLMLLLIQTANHPFQMPCVFSEIVMHYGATKQEILHTGIDLKVESQTPVKCCFDGVVRMAKYYGQYGKMVVVRHYNGLETVYAHLDNLCVRTGQILEAGNLVGRAGQTGDIAIPVLHFEIRFMNEHLDPEMVIDFENKSLIKNTLVLRSSYFTNNPQVDTTDTRSDTILSPVQ